MSMSKIVLKNGVKVEVILIENGVDVEAENRKWKYWESVVTEEPLNEEMKILLRKDLAEQWHWYRLAGFRLLTKHIWDTVDTQKILLNSAEGGPNEESLLYQMCNKATGFYWLQTSQSRINTGEKAICRRIVLAAVFDEWMRCNNMQPRLDYGHFFANPVRITPTGPLTISGVIRAHLALCEQASQQLRIDKKKEKTQFYSILPLYRAIIVIIDRKDEKGESWTDGKASYCVDGAVSVSKYAQVQTVLVVLTGIEEGLKRSISLESLRSHSLPLERCDVLHAKNVVRVPISVAVRFIVDLEKMEDSIALRCEDDFPVEPYLLTELKGSQCKGEEYSSQKAWVDSVMNNAEEIGFDNNSLTFDAIRRVKARLSGDPLDNSHDPFRRGWVD